MKSFLKEHSIILNTDWRFSTNWQHYCGYSQKVSSIVSHDYGALNQEEVTQADLNRYVELVREYITNAEEHPYLVSGILSEAVRGEIAMDKIEEEIALMRLEN